MKTFAAVVLGSLFPGFASAQAGPAAPAADGARVISIEGAIERFGPCGDAARPLALGDLLHNGCQLTATDAAATVQLACTNGATQQLLTGGFVAVINGTGVPSCVLKLDVGSAMATSSGDANETGSAVIETEPGAIGAVVTHTSVVVTVPASGAADGEAYVVDGEAKITRGGETISLAAGKMTYARTKAVGDIPETRLRWVANNLAIASTAGAGSELTAASRSRLSDRYLAVYKNSGNPAARAELVRELEAVAAPDNSFTRYQASRAVQLGAGAYVAAQPAVANPMQGGVFGGAVMGAFASQKRLFMDPVIAGRRVDYCLHWGVECGQPAADAFCQAKKFSRAVEFTVAADIGTQTPTLVIGDKTVCANPGCDGFASIRCQ